MTREMIDGETPQFTHLLTEKQGVYKPAMESTRKTLYMTQLCRLGRWVYEINMAKNMTAKEKLVFIISFVVFLHWGVNVSSLVINNLFYQ